MDGLPTIDTYMPEKDRSCFFYASRGGGLWSHHFGQKYGRGGVVRVEDHFAVVQALTTTIQRLQRALAEREATDA